MSDAIEIRVKYFAALREGADCNEEVIMTLARTPKGLYEELQKRHSFVLHSDQLKVAVNNEFQSMNHSLKGGETLVFIPPVAGG